MANDSSSQRIYRAPCPGCGAPVEFRSAQSLFAVCPYCRSTVVRQGETLARIGKMAELFEDFSPLQLFSAGSFQGKAFIVIGRLQYGYEGGRWTEWIADFDGERTGVLSEDNGTFVFAFPLALQRPPMQPGALRVGALTAVDGQSFTVASRQEVALLSAQGELPRLPEIGRRFEVVELRNDRGEVLSLEYERGEPTAYLGREVRLDELSLTGLRDTSTKEETGRSFGCPNCGAPVTVKLPDSKSVVCASCKSIIDLGKGIGGELRHAAQDEPVEPLIPLGQVGRLQGASWQVVGFQHRMGVVPGDDEHFGWNEYLVYSAERGFGFLVDAEDGWSFMRPAAGAPRLPPGGDRAVYLNKTYRQAYAYDAETTYVAGEFYWRVERGQKTSNRDFTKGPSLLSMERSRAEINWSIGSRLNATLVASAFKLDGKKELLQRKDALPLSGLPALGCGTIIMVLLVIFILLIILSTCTNSGGGSRTSGGAYGGYSSGGGHK